MIGTHDLIFASVFGLMFGFIAGVYYSGSFSTNVRYVEASPMSIQAPSEGNNIVIEGFKGGSES